MLHEIAASNYECETEQNFAQLQTIRDHQQIPAPHDFISREVLELIRWSEPEDPLWKPGSTGGRGHIMRAFSCAVLLIAADDSEQRQYMFSENETLIALVSSVLYLGGDAYVCGLRFVSWRVKRQSIDEWELPFFLLALMLIRVALFEPHEHEASLVLLADWIVDEEAHARTVELPNSEDWLLGLTFHDLKHEVWKRMAKEVLLDPAKSFSEPASAAIRNIAYRLHVEV